MKEFPVIITSETYLFVVASSYSITTQFGFWITTTHFGGDTPILILGTGTAPPSPDHNQDQPFSSSSNL